MLVAQAWELLDRRWGPVPWWTLSGRQWLAGLIVVTLMLRIPGLALISIGQAIAIPCLIGLTYVGRPYLRLAAFTTLGAIASGLALVVWSGWFANLTVSAVAAGEVVLWSVAVVAGGVGLAWSVPHVGVQRSALIIACVGLIDYLVVIRNWEEPWRFGVGQFVTLAIAALLWDRSRIIVAAAMLPLIGLSLVTATRSLALAQCFALLVGFLLWRQERVGRKRWLRELAATGAALTLVLALTPWAAGNGWLGGAIRERQELNTSGGQSVALGARLEWVAAGALAGSRPAGFGAGTQPSEADKQLVYSATASREGADGYFRDIVFQDRVDLHSGTLNAWYHLGPGGVLWGAVIAWLSLLGLAAIPSGSGGQIALAFVITMGLWHWFFSPLLAATYVSAGLGFALYLRWQGVKDVPWKRQRPRSGQTESS